MISRVPQTSIGRRLLSAAFVSIAFASTVGAARAAADVYPNRHVRFIVPYPPGGITDVLARTIAQRISTQWGQQMVVDNRAGASGNIGSQAVARAAPDGRTLMVQVNTFVMNPSLFKQVPYDPVGNFAPIVKLTTGDLVLAVNPDVRADGPKALADLARAKPGGIDYASPGNGTPQHLAMELFRLTAGVDMNHVPYRGSAPAIQDLIGRRVAAMVLPVHTALPLAQDGQSRMLAVGSDQRAEATPDVPTMAEAGFPGFQVDLWYGLFGPAGLPADYVQRLNADLNVWLAEPGTREQLRNQGMVPAGGTPEELGELVRRDLQRWAEVIRRARITAD
jgi:tripartite-type tricarboxylate transporter receptor subunit TctC